MERREGEKTGIERQRYGKRVRKREGMRQKRERKRMVPTYMYMTIQQL